MTLVCRKLVFREGGLRVLIESRAVVKLRFRHRFAASRFLKERRVQQLDSDSFCLRIERLAEVLADPALSYAWFAMNHPDKALSADSGIRSLSNKIAAARVAPALNEADRIANTLLLLVTRLRPEQQRQLIEILPTILKMFKLEDTDGQ